MKKLYIIKVGTTFPATARIFGDFDLWTETALGRTDVDPWVLDVEHGAELPAVTECAGVVVTGSHSMVTDNLPWSLRTEKWISSLLENDIPFFGICYGHQLLARAAGGQVGFHRNGKEIGTVEIRLCAACAGDALFEPLPPLFSVHVTHSQTVLHLPPGAVRLAASACEPTQAFRLGNSAWGVQFHPEYTVGIMRSYIEEQRDELESAEQNVPALLDGVTATPHAAETIRNFARLVKNRMEREYTSEISSA